MENLVFKGENSQALTNSLLVAEKFGKEHRNVLQSIRDLMGTAEFSAYPQMFVETVYYNQQNGQEYPMFVMNRDGFTLLAMGFTGKKAMKFKLDYIAAFNKMEKALKDGQKNLSGAEYLLQQAQLMVEQERRLKTLENRMDTLDKEREENGRKLLGVKLSDERAPQQTMKSKIRELVNQYSSATNTSQQNVWHLVYKKLYYVYHISINSYHKLTQKESKLNVAERNGLLGKIFTIVSDLIRDTKAA